MGVRPVLLGQVALQADVRREDPQLGVGAVQPVEVPAGRRLLHVLQQPVGQEEAPRRGGVLPGDGLDRRPVLDVEPAGGPIEAGHVDADVGEVQRDLVVPGRHGGGKDGVVDGLRRLPRVVRVHVERPRERTHAEQRRGLRVAAVHPRVVPRAERGLGHVEGLRGGRRRCRRRGRRRRGCNIAGGAASAGSGMAGPQVARRPRSSRARAGSTGFRPMERAYAAARATSGALPSARTPLAR